jgi:hypothetical protein
MDKSEEIRFVLSYCYSSGNWEGTHFGIYHQAGHVISQNFHHWQIIDATSQLTESQTVLSYMPEELKGQ